MEGLGGVLFVGGSGVWLCLALLKLPLIRIHKYQLSRGLNVDCDFSLLEGFG